MSEAGAAPCGHPLFWSCSFAERTRRALPSAGDSEPVLALACGVKRHGVWAWLTAAGWPGWGGGCGEFATTLGAVQPPRGPVGLRLALACGPKRGRAWRTAGGRSSVTFFSCYVLRPSLVSGF